MPSISITKGHGNVKHNDRTHSRYAPNIDQSRTELNQTLVQRDIKQLYHEEFDLAVGLYNLKQKRADRRIDDYYRKIVHDKKTKAFHELVIQVGNKDDNLDLKTTNSIYSEFLNEFQKNNPKLIVFGAYIHNDEKTAHMHLDYVPIADYPKGQFKRVSNNRAIKQMGYKHWEHWHDEQMLTLEKVINHHGLEREVMNNTNRHIDSVAEFKARAQARDKLIKSEIKKEIVIQKPKTITVGHLNNKKEVVQQTPEQYHNHEKKHELEKLDLKAKIDILNADLEIANSKYEKLNNKSYVLENKRLEVEIIEKNNQIQKLENDLSTSDLNNLYLETDLNEVKSKLNKSREMYSNQNQKLSLLETENGMLKSKVKDLNARIEDLSPENLRILKAENQKLRSSLEASNSANKTLTAENKNQQAKNIELNRDKSQLLEENKRLRAELDVLKSKVNELLKTVEQFKTKLLNISMGQNTIRATISYVRDWFTQNETGKAILNGIEKTIVQFAKEDGVDERINDSIFIGHSIMKNMTDIDLTYKSGREGKGVYDKNNELVCNFDSLKEARETFKNVKIRDGRNRELCR